MGCEGHIQKIQRDRFLRWTGPMGRRVLKFDGPLARGLWYRPLGDEYKVSVTDSPFCIIWHDRHSADWLTAFATKEGSCGMVHEIYGSLFFLSILLVSP